MALRMFSVIGESLNFGGRRIELIARVAWLPVFLLLIVNMATVFAYLSVIAGKAITFTDVSSFLQAQQYVAQYAERGWNQAPGRMTLISAVNILLQIILVSSFLTPLIRYSGLGERPAPGLFRLPFGVDQVRFVVAGFASFLFMGLIIILPMAGTSFFVMQYIVEAMSQPLAAFPDEESLHTIEIVTSGSRIAESGTSWIFDLALPLAAAAPFALLVWLLGVIHFHPRNRPHAGEGGNPIARAFVVFLVVGGLAASAFFLLRGAVVETISAGGEAAAESAGIAGSPVQAMLVFMILGGMLLAYFNIRLFAYPGVAVCRHSLAPGPALAVTRGWNLFRLPVILILISGSLLIAQFAINAIVLPAILSTLNTLFQATETSTRLVNSGAAGQWVLPLFVWIWNLTKIAVNFFWTFFSFGVVAGLYGRLYRESVKLG